jgi:hypothetical protein
MKSKFLFTSLLAFGCIFAEESSPQETPEVRQHFGHFDIGVGPLPIPLPVFTGGYRAQWGHHGMDVSLQASTIVSYTQIKANFLYNHYFKPSLDSEFYVGGGVGPSIVIGRGECEFLISPELVFGKLYRNETKDLRFWQIQVSFPTFDFHQSRHHHSHCTWFPLVVASYGFGF